MSASSTYDSPHTTHPIVAAHVSIHVCEALQCVLSGPQLLQGAPSSYSPTQWAHQCWANVLFPLLQPEKSVSFWCQLRDREIPIAVSVLPLCLCAPPSPGNRTSGWKHLCLAAPWVVAGRWTANRQCRQSTLHWIWSVGIASPRRKKFGRWTCLAPNQLVSARRHTIPCWRVAENPRESIRMLESAVARLHPWSQL